MVKKAVKAKLWTKPEIERLGEIRDVAGPSNVGTQGGKS